MLCGRGILDSDDRIDWRNCEISESEEIEFVSKLKQNFKPFDFTNDGDSDGD